MGEIYDGKRNGKGMATYADESKYVGEWRDDKPSGKGTAFAPDGSIIAQEIYSNGVLVK